MENKSSKKLTVAQLRSTTTYQAGVLQATMNRQLKKFTDTALQEFGLTTMQWFIIGTIYDSGTAGVRISDLTRKVDTNMPYITNTVNLLESKGILTKTGGLPDSRSKIIKVAEAFMPRYDVIEQSLRTKMRAGIYSRVTPAELQTYLDVIAKLSDISE